MEKLAMSVYDLAWGLAIPWLRRNPRLAEGFGQRTLQPNTQSQADLWIHAASAGESYLAWSLLKELSPDHPLRVLVTTNTSQGMGILKRAIDDITPNTRGITAWPAYFPFDRPSIMETAVRTIRPKVMVLLELEIWPGLLSALKKYHCNILVINGRITPKSLRRYLIWPSLWQSLGPDKVLAISESDAERFAALFGKDRVEVMPNMKFDRLGTPPVSVKNPLKEIFDPDHQMIVLGSTRQEEEPLVGKMIRRICHQLPKAVIGLFPRHMHRIGYWKSALTRLALPWMLRSQVRKPVSQGTIILWDTFGELSLTYELANAAYVGGSLVPLGGQNFLEPLTCGVIPVIGPSWENFSWVGQEIMDQGLVRMAADWKAGADILTEHVTHPQPRKAVREAALRYVKDRQGGTERACRVLDSYDR